jgi:hypothetical protein
MVAKGCGLSGGQNRPGARPPPTILRRVRRLALLLPLLVACSLAACGGGGDEEGVEDLLDQAFSQDIRSADIDLEAELDLNGMLDEPIRIEAEGPYRSNEGKLPAADIELRIGTDGGGQTITSGVLVTGDRAFVKFQDVYYEQPPARVREANRAIQQDQRRGDRPLGELGLDPRSWLGEAEDEGDAEVAGVQTRHVSGTLDVERLLRNLNEFVRRSGSALGDATGQPAPPRLNDEDIRELAAAVQDPTFDVYVGKDDDIIRRVSGRVEFEIPERNREELGGLEGGSIVFSVELADVNGDQEIEAPANARPLSDLTASLGGGALADGLGGSGGQGAAPVAPDDPDPPSSSAGGGNGTGQVQPPPEDADGDSPEAEAFRRYAECLDDARPEDTEELQRCADLLDQP